MREKARSQRLSNAEIMKMQRRQRGHKGINAIKHGAEQSETAVKSALI